MKTAQMIKDLEAEKRLYQERMTAIDTSLEGLRKYQSLNGGSKVKPDTLKPNTPQPKTTPKSGKIACPEDGCKFKAKDGTGMASHGRTAHDWKAGYHPWKGGDK